MSDISSSSDMPEMQMGLRFARKTASTLGSIFLRNFSESPLSGPPETCFLMGRNGLISLPGYGWTDVKEYVKKKPLLHNVPTDRLFFIDPKYPYMSYDGSRYLMRSGVTLPHYCYINKLSCSGAFRMDNVGVIEHLGMFAFRSLDQDDARKWLSDLDAGYQEYGVFLSDLFHQHEPSLKAYVPMEIRSLLSSLKLPVAQYYVLDHPAFLSDLEYGEMSTEVHRILRKEFYVRNEGFLARKIITGLSTAHPGGLSICQNHPVLNEFLPHYMRNPYFPPLVPRPWIAAPAIVRVSDPDWKAGVLLVDTNRNGSVHSVEAASVEAVKAYMPAQAALNLLEVPFTRKEILQLLRYELPEYLPYAYKCFSKESKWYMLDTRSRKPIPSIFLA